MRLSHCVEFALFAALSSLAVACGTPEVGAPCLPEDVPVNGYQGNEAYIETSSVQCETRVCMVYELMGDPREGCVPRACAPDDPACVPLECPTQTQIDEHVYCTCRCRAPDSSFAECDCPAGYVCEEVLREGDEGVQGGYCVNARTTN